MNFDEHSCRSIYDNDKEFHAYQMRKKIFHYFQICAATTTKVQDRRNFLLGAIGLRSDGVIVKSFNGHSHFPNRRAHAEYRLAQKLDVGSTVYVVRVRLGDGKMALAYPCKSCQKVLASKGVKKIYFSINENEFGVITF